MALNFGELSPVFTSILDGSFWSSVDSFQSNQLRPFLPLLIASTFQESRDQHYDEVLLSRLSMFPEGNRLLKLFRTDFHAVQCELNSSARQQFSNSFTICDDVTRMKMIIRYIREDTKDEPIAPTFITADMLPDAGMILSSAYIRMPTLFSIETLTLRFLSLKVGPALIVLLIANAPEILKPVLSVLLGLQVSDECAKGRQKAEMLAQLFAFCPSICWSTIHEMTSSRRDCLLSVRLACSFLPDEEFVNLIQPLIVDRSSQLSTMISRSASRPTLGALHARLMTTIKAALESGSSKPLTGVLQCVAVLQLQCDLKLSSEHLSMLCAFICRRNVTDDAHIVLALATLVAVQSFTTPAHQAGVTPSIDPRIGDWLEWLSDETETGEREVLSNTLIYFSVCLFSSKTDQLAALLSSMLQCKVIINSRHGVALKALFTSSCLSETDLAERCESLPITNNLSLSSGERLPIHSIAEMMHSGIFSRHCVDISKWLEKQLSCTSTPTHPLLPEVVEKFAIESARSQRAGLAADFIQDVFSGALLDDSLLSVRCMVLLFLLSYRAQLDRIGSRVISIHKESAYTRIPIRYLLSVVECRGEDFVSAKQSLIRLTADLFPYMLPTIDSIELARAPIPGIAVSKTVDQMLLEVAPGDPKGVARRLALAPLTDQVRLLPVVVKAFFTSLASTERPVVDCIIGTWSRLESVIPRVLYELSAKSWMVKEASNLETDDLYEYPTMMFRCDKRILNSPAHFRCFLRVVAFFVSASKNRLVRSVHAANNNSSPLASEADRADREQCSIAMEHTQVSLLVQLLVEVSDPERMGDDTQSSAKDSSAKEKVRHLIRSSACEYIHQLFIKDKNVVKLVMFQTIPLHMVPLLVEDVPSMFVAVDHMQEMLALPDLNRRIFAIALMVHISKKYRISSACVSTEMILDVLNTLLKYAETTPNIKLFLRVVPTLAKITTIFPQLAGDVTHLLMRVSALAKARLAMRPMVICSTNCEEKRLLDLIKSSLHSEVRTVIQ